MMTKTKAEIEALKENWRGDPCWDIEDTEGFEDHREELWEYRLEMRNQWKRQYEERIQKRANELGCSVAMVELIEGLERQLEKIQEKIE